MDWIDIKKQIPEIAQKCWFYDQSINEVFDGYFSDRIDVNEGTNHSIRRGFIFSDYTESYVDIRDVSQWKKYYTPDPPKES